MDDRAKTLAAISIIVGFLVLIVVVIGVILTRKNFISPVPEEGVIKIIFISPTPLNIMPTEIATPSAGKKS